MIKLSIKKGKSVLKNKLKRAVDDSSDRLREVFNETCRNDPCSSLVTFRQMESSICKRRRKMYPRLPLDPEDLCQLIHDSPFVHLYRGSVCSEGSYTVIFASDFMLQKMKDVEQIQI